MLYSFIEIDVAIKPPDIICKIDFYKSFRNATFETLYVNINKPLFDKKSLYIHWYSK